MLVAAPFVILPLCNAVLQLLNTWLEHGLGGVFALIIVGGACTLYYFLVRWIVTAGKGTEAASPEEGTVSVDA